MNGLVGARRAPAAAAAGCGPHVVLVPVPAQGHINPAVSIARYLAASGICVTLVYAARAHSLLLSAASRSNGGLHETDHQISNNNLNMRVEVIPDGMPSADAKKRVSVEEVGASIGIMRKGLEDLLSRLIHEQPNPPCCLIIDSILAWGPDVALHFGLPRIGLWTSSASSLSIGIHIPHLLSRGYLPVTDQASRERIIDIVPGLPSLCIADLPPLFITEEGLKSPPYQFISSAFENAKSADRVLVNTMYELESAVVDDLRKEGGVRVEPVGPLFLIHENAPAASLIEEDTHCLTWLDKHARSSVLYVSFGSMANVEDDVFAEVAYGLEASGEAFLWVIRPDAYDAPGSSTATSPDQELLPKGFVERTGRRGLVISWAPQLAVLGHPAVGAFLTHCGWNSVIESLSSGVPMLGFPQQADQSTNLKHIVFDWKVGLPLVPAGTNIKVERSHVQTSVCAIMRGDEGSKAREHALAWRDTALDSAASISGTSISNLEQLVHDLKSGRLGV